MPALGAVLATSSWAIILACSAQTLATDYQYTVDASSHANYLALTSTGGTQHVTWSRSSPSIGVYRHDLLFLSPATTLPITNVSIATTGPLDFTWSGSVDGTATAGTIVFFEGDDDTATYVVFYNDNEDVVLGFELPSEGLAHVGITINSDPALKCVCWQVPPTPTCTPAQCDENAYCGTPPGSAACQWRHLVGGTM